VMEDDRLCIARTPILVEDLGAVLGLDRRHRPSPGKGGLCGAGLVACILHTGPERPTYALVLTMTPAR
jgi:hypothetical protein